MASPSILKLYPTNLLAIVLDPFFYFLEAIYVNISGVIGYKLAWLNLLSYSPSIKIWFLDCCKSLEYSNSCSLDY
jgi:hypothetical protein